MVIQSNMSPKSIVEVWENTAPIFMKFNVPLIDKTLESIIESEILPNHLIELLVFHQYIFLTKYHSVCL